MTVALFSTPEAHLANPPETWQVVKAAERIWHLTTEEGTVLERFTRKVDAETVRDLPSSWLRAAYDKEGRWYGGGTIPGWKSWAECKAERERNAACWGGRV